MNQQIPRTAWIILALHLTATVLLLLFGYGVQKPAVETQEFPFSITYTYRRQQNTVSGVYVAEYTTSAQYLGDSPLHWFGYIKDHNRLEPDFIRIADDEIYALSIDLNLEPGWLMGDSAYADAACAPSAVAIRLEDEERITDPAELEALGFQLYNWDYPQPIENSFSFAGISMSSEAVLYTSAIAIAALLASLIFVKRSRRVPITVLSKISAVLNVLVLLLAFPFILVVSAMSEMLGEATILQQVLYLAPALTVTGVTASLVLRRRGYALFSFLFMFLGPAVFALAVLYGQY